jgi:predicted HTH domain antitoxin
VKSAAELAGAEMRNFRELLDRQRRVQVAPGMGEDALNPVGFRFQLQQS